MASELNQTGGEGRASGVLQDVSQISGRGCVAVFGNLEGMVCIGDLALFLKGPVKITGLELIHYSDPSKRPDNTIGLLLSVAEKEALLPFKGVRIDFAEGEG